MQSDFRSKFKRPESILLVIHTSHNEFLLLKRVRPPLYWQSVTGSIHWTDESPAEAAVRELWEETGIVAQFNELEDWNRRFRFVIPKSMRNRFAPEAEMNVEHMFSIRLSHSLPVALRSDEHSAHCWVDGDEANSLVWSWSNREAIRMVCEAGI